MKQVFLIISILAVLILSGPGCQKGGGEVFASVDGGATWERKTASAFSLASIIDVAISPKDKSIVYVATKEKGLFRSSDSGKNWSLVANFDSPISLFKIHPKNQNILYLVAGKGLFRSNDRGNTFQEIFYEQQVFDIAFHPSEENKIYIGTDKGSVLKSDNNGDTWETLYWTENGEKISLIKINPFNPNLIFAVINKNEIIKSLNGGKNFEKLETNIKGYAINDIEIQDNNILYLAANKGLLKSEDTGKTFSEIKTLMPPEDVGIRILKASSQDNNIFYYVTQNAIYKTTDAGRTWKVFRIIEGAIYNSLAVSPQDPNIVFVGANTQKSFLK